MCDSLDLGKLREQSGQLQKAIKSDSWVGTAAVAVLCVWVLFSEVVAQSPDISVRILLPTVFVSLFVWGSFDGVFRNQDTVIEQLRQARTLIRQALPNVTQKHIQPKSKLARREIPAVFTALIFTWMLWLEQQTNLVLVALIIWIVYGAWVFWRWFTYYRGLDVDFERLVARRLLYSEITNGIIMGGMCLALTRINPIIGIVILLVFIVVARSWQFAAQRLFLWVSTPYRAGNYTLALKRVRIARRIQPQIIRYVTIEASLLATLKRYNEAEALHYSVLAYPHTDTVTLAVTMAELGEIKLDLEQYPEALSLLEAAVQIAPDVWIFYLMMADWYLVQFTDGERALEFADFGFELLTAPTSKPDTDSLFGAYCTVAQATALAGRTERAKAALENVSKNHNAKKKLQSARLAYINGYVNHAQGNMEAAREWYQSVQSIDPDGLYTRYAQRYLARLT